ncbi:MAG: hypothetical protein V1685_04120 [Parcubacteria group bacterium]
MSNLFLYVVTNRSGDDGRGFAPKGTASGMAGERFQLFTGKTY